jgi:hypothetical protein
MGLDCVRRITVYDAAAVAAGGAVQCAGCQMNNLTIKSDDELRALLHTSRQTLIMLSESLAGRPDMQEAIRILMRPDHMLETFSELAVREPDLMRLVLQACVAAMVNVQSQEAVEVEIKRRPVTLN